MAVNNVSLKNLEKGKMFSSSYQPKKRGRKPSIIKKYIKQYDLSKTDVDAVIQTILFNRTVDELNKISSDPKEGGMLPAFVGFILNLIQKSVDKGDPRAISYLLDRIYGKPKEDLDLAVNSTINPQTINNLNTIIQNAISQAEVNKKVIKEVKPKK